MKSMRWIFTEAILSITSITVGWLIPDGLNRVALLLGQPHPAPSATERLLSTMVVFLFTSTLQLILFVRSEVRNLREAVPDIVGTALADQTGAALDSSLLRIMLEGVNTNSSTLAQTRLISRSIANILGRAHAYLRDAEAVVIERAISNLSHEVELLSHDGLQVDIRDHIEISRRLSANSNTYLQIQRKTFLVPQEWTREWMDFASRLPASGTKCQYIVLVDESTLVSDRLKLESMNRFLSKAGWNFSYCALQDILDSLGGILPTEWNVEVIDGKVVKLQELATSRYQGGIKLRLLLFTLSQRNDLGNFASVVVRYSKKFSPDLFTAKGH